MSDDRAPDESLVKQYAAERSHAEFEGSTPQLNLLERIRAMLGGTVTIMPGVDLTEPLRESEGGEA